MKTQVELAEDRGFRQGLAYAVAELIRRDEMTIARELWINAGANLRDVEDFDAQPIRRARKNGWTR